MSQLLISIYIREIESRIRQARSANERGNRKAFFNLIDACCALHNPDSHEKFDTCRFADYKEQIIDLPMRVATQHIVAAAP